MNILTIGLFFLDCKYQESMMSTSGESSDGEAEQYEPAIAPLAPKVILQEEGQVEVSASPAFQCLDEVRIRE